ncbi:MAG: hypothetical protein M5U26_00215 [Planctomycetota bacterium]|nr:hypothetical protein [Planctomycetota bacterium]
MTTPAPSGQNGSAEDAEAGRPLQRPLLERWGLRYFARRSRHTAAAAPFDAVHTLTPEEQDALRRLERGAVARAALAGALSALLAALVEILALPHFLRADGSPQLAYWILIGAVSVSVAVCEIAYLYWITLRTVHDLSLAAGLELFPPDGRAEAEAVAAALARAALELPNPSGGAFGVDPHLETPRWRLLAVSLLYKAKVGLTNFVAKALVRRALSRAALRAYAPLAAVPVTALWDALVCRWAVREARIRVMGPSAARAYVSRLFGAAPPRTDAGRRAALHAVAAGVVSTRDLHPNLVALLAEVSRRLGAAPGERGETRAFLECLPKLPPDERGLTLELLTLALILDGRVSATERRLWRDARRACGLDPDARLLRRLLRAFVKGREIPLAELRLSGT